MKYNKNDKVKIYSLQSFHGGGFLNGVEGTVSQDQGKGGSVLVAVERNFNGKIKMDGYFEVYPEQLRIIERANDTSVEDRFEIMDL